jgi:hypothetical protein
VSVNSVFVQIARTPAASSDVSSRGIPSGVEGCDAPVAAGGSSSRADGMGAERVRALSTRQCCSSPTGCGDVPAAAEPPSYHTSARDIGAQVTAWCAPSKRCRPISAPAPQRLTPSTLESIQQLAELDDPLTIETEVAGEDLSSYRDMISRTLPIKIAHCQNSIPMINLQQSAIRFPSLDVNNLAVGSHRGVLALMDRSHAVIRTEGKATGSA